MNEVWPYILALAPPVGVGFLFYKIIRAILEGDRNERLAQSQWEASRGEREQVRSTHSNAARGASADRPSRGPSSGSSS